MVTEMPFDMEHRYQGGSSERDNDQNEIRSKEKEENKNMEQGCRGREEAYIIMNEGQRKQTTGAV